MSSQKSGPPRRRLASFKLRIALVVALAVVAWFFHPPVLTWAARRTLVAWCSANRLDFSARTLDVRLDGPVVAEGVRIRSTPGSGRFTSLDIARIESKWNGIFLKKNGRFIRVLAISGLSGTWDFSGDGGVRGALGAARWNLAFVPETFSAAVPSLELVGDGRKVSLRDFSVTLSESGSGELKIGGLGVLSDLSSRSFGPIRARTAWKYGTLWLAEMEVIPGIVVENLSADPLRAGGPALSFTADCFGGSLRGDAAISTTDGTVDVAAWAANIPLDRAVPPTGLAKEAAGRLAEGRFTFRGRPGRPADAEASLRMVAEGFQWNRRGWESLEVGASLIHRRLVVSGFELRQKENRVVFDGEISLAEGWSEIARAPFLLRLNADIRELGSLAGLLGGPMNEAAGRMTAVGSVSGRAGRVDGFLSVEASGATFRSMPPSSLRAEAVFREGGVEIARCDVYSKKDSASLRGTIAQAAPHQYAAEVNARIADLATYLSPFRAPGTGLVNAGALDVLWQGDGTEKSHSGAFDVKLKEFVSGTTPAGITGEFAGTYSPQNLYFSKIQIAKGPLRLESRATFAREGITLKDVGLRSGTRTLLEGAAFIPINLYAVNSAAGWRAAIDPNREAYLRAAASEELSIRPLLELAGQQSPLDGRLRVAIEAGGAPARPNVACDLSVADLVWKHQRMSPSRLNVKFRAADGNATLACSLDTKGASPVRLDARMPFGLVPNDGGRWLDPAGALAATLDFPQADPAVPALLIPWLRLPAGSASGRLEISGTVGAPRANGSLAVKDGKFSMAGLDVQKSDLVLEFEGARARIAQFRGEVGGGSFEVSGSIGLDVPSDPAWDVRVRAENIPLVPERGINLLANADISAAGNNAGGRLAGTLRVVGGKIAQHLEATPGLPSVPTRSEEKPRMAAGLPEPFARWDLDLKVSADPPIPISGRFADGAIIPNLTLTGTPSAPVPVGRIALRDVTAFLPFMTMTIPDGRVDFFPDEPWVPVLDIRAEAVTPEGTLRAFAFGPLDERKLILRSDPPRPQDLLVRLLAEGREAPPPLPLAHPTPADPVRWLDAPAGARGTLGLVFDIATGQDGLFPAAATYTWRLR